MYSLEKDGTSETVEDLKAAQWRGIVDLTANQSSFQSGSTDGQAEEISVECTEGNRVSEVEGVG